MMDANLHWLAGLAEILLFMSDASKPDLRGLSAIPGSAFQLALKRMPARQRKRVSKKSILFAISLRPRTIVESRLTQGNEDRV